MSRSNPSTRPYAVAERAQPVQFAMVNDEAYADSTLEPGMVRIRESNSAVLYASGADDTSPGTPCADSVVSTPDDAILLQRIKRIGVSSAAVHHNTPVINETNNVILCYDVATNRVYTITITPGNYVTPQQLITAFQTAKTASGLVTQFQYTFKGATPPAYLAGYAPKTDSSVLLVTSTPVLFLPQSPGIIKGRSTFGWTIGNNALPQWDGLNPVNSVLQAAYTASAITEMTIGPMKCCYTQYVDIMSRTMTRWGKLSNVSTTTVSHSLLYRIYMPDFDGYPTDPGVILVADDRSPVQTPSAIIYKQPVMEVASATNRLVYHTIQPRESVTTIDFQLFDEYGSIFYTPSIVYSRNSGTTIASRVASDSVIVPINAISGVNTGGLSWNINFYCEL